MENKIDNIQNIKHTTNKLIENDISNFVNNFKEKTKSPKNFITLDEIESNLEKLNIDIKNKCLDMTSNILDVVDEKILIENKKKNF